MLKAALIGAGAIAREHLAALADLGSVELAAVCDVSAAKAEAAAERFHVRRWYTSHHAMLAEVRPDLVHITTPPTSHFSIARDCLSAHLNVLCEKPITVEYAEFVQLKALATRNGQHLMENQNLRFNSSVLRICELIRSGELGEVADVQVNMHLNVGARGSRFVDRNAPHPCLSMRGGAIADFLTHLAYTAYVFAGRPVGIRTTWGKRNNESVLPADEFRALMRCERSVASVAFSANAQPNGCWLRVAGTRMHAEANLFEPPRLTLRRLRDGVPPLMMLVDGLAEAGAVFRGATVGLWRKLGDTSRYDGLPTLMAKTYTALEKGGPLPVPLEEVDDIARMVAAFTDPDRML